jgi:hypothetical protein
MSQPEKRENSVLFSLRELRQIEDSRVQEEEHAVRSKEEQRATEMEAKERGIREAEEAKLRAENDEKRRIFEARENAEREARMHVEATEATERARHQANLEQQRLQHEMEMRRAEVAKKRPTWMLAVTGLALVAAVGLVFFAIQRKNDSEAAEAQARQSEIDKAEAQKVARDASEQLAKVQRDLEDLDTKVTKAVTDVAQAKNANEIAAAQANLVALQRQQSDAKARVFAAQAAAAAAERHKGAHISVECQNNPLAKGC